MPKPGHVYKRFAIPDGRKVTLRALQTADLDAIRSFINTLVKEKQEDPKSSLYAGFDTRVTRREEAEWLSEIITAIREGSVTNVIAEIDGKIIANGEVTRGHYKETRHYGHLGLTMIREYRGLGIGKKLIVILVRESRKNGLRRLDAEFLAKNESARHAYERAGFKQVGIIPSRVYRNGKYLDGLIMARKL